MSISAAQMKRADGLDLAVRSCMECPLWHLRGGDDGGHACPAEVGRHYERSGIAVMCEAPGKDENDAGRPLVGRAGKMADSLFVQSGIRRSDLLLLNRVRCRPPRNRLADYPEAIAACDVWNRAELEEYNPAVVVLMGATAMEPIFGAKPKVGKLHGTIRATGPNHAWGERVFVATYHPAAELHSGQTGVVAAMIVEDLRLAQEIVVPF